MYKLNGRVPCEKHAEVVKLEGDARGVQYQDSRMADQLSGNCREINYSKNAQQIRQSRIFLHRHFLFYVLIFLQYKSEEEVFFLFLFYFI
jgi:hypothetical protein